MDIVVEECDVKMVGEERHATQCGTRRGAQRFTALVYATFRSPTTPHRSRVTRHLPADIGHGNGWILLSDSTNQRRAMAGYCYQILTNQSVPPMRGRV